MSKPKSIRTLPSLADLITTLENVSEIRGAFHLNIFITCLAGYAINTWLGGLTSTEELRRYFSKLYELLVSGSYELDKEVMEIVATLGSDVINEATYDEIINKILIIFKDMS